MNIIDGVKPVYTLEQIRKNVNNSNLSDNLKRIKNLASKLGFIYTLFETQSLKGNHLTKTSAIKQITGTDINHIHTIKSLNTLINTLERSMVKDTVFEIAGLPSCVCVSDMDYNGFADHNGSTYSIKTYLNSLKFLSKNTPVLSLSDKKMINALVNNYNLLDKISGNLIGGEKLLGYWGLVANLINDNSLPTIKKLTNISKETEVKILQNKDEDKNKVILNHFINTIENYSPKYAKLIKYNVNHLEWLKGYSSKSSALMVESSYSLYLCNASILNSGGLHRTIEPLTMFMSWAKAYKLFTSGKTQLTVTPKKTPLGTVFTPK